MRARRFHSLALDLLPYVGTLRAKIRELRTVISKQGLYPGGHFYSPIPAATDVEYFLAHRQEPILSDIDLNQDGQLKLLETFAKYYDEIQFPEEADHAHRFYWRQDWFSYGDAISLFCFIRNFRPNRIVEIGAGYSSALILDTLQQLGLTETQLTIIEPFPERLNKILRGEDRARCTILETRLQQMPEETFLALEAGDLLFIDSSHVVKLGSDLHSLFFRILPQLKPGVYVHFHDIHFPFEYPGVWLKQGRFWNETYLLRAFLSYNSAWEITLFNSMAGAKFTKFLEETMPRFLVNAGGSIYIRRKL